MSLAKNQWTDIVRNILDVIAAATIVGLVVVALSIDDPEAVAGPLQDSTLIMPHTVYVQTSAISVNRTLKGDRVSSASLIQRRSNSPPSSEVAPPFSKRIPVGCEPAFSPVADPSRAHIYGRCIA